MDAATNTKMFPNTWYSLKELADILPVSKTTIYKAVNNGEIPSFRIVNRILVRGADLEAKFNPGA